MLYGRYDNKRSNLNELKFDCDFDFNLLNFVKLKQRIFKRHSTSYWPNVGVGDVEKF